MWIAANLEELRERGITRVVLTCGVFDGLHRGHQRLIDQASALAAERQAAPVLFTFAPHPAAVLCPSKAPKLILAPVHKQALLRHFGIAAMVRFPFNAEVAAIEPEAFLHDLFGTPGVEIAGIVVGEHWRFGYKARGDLALLRQVGERHGCRVIGVPELLDEQLPVSSTRIRAAIAAGDLTTAERLLGRPFSLLGEVAHGKGIGTTELHYPTANLNAASEVFPPSGIYAARAYLWDDPPTERRSVHDGILYLGFSPTFIDRPPEKPFIETHIFAFDRDIYGCLLETEFVQFIRPDARYDSAEALCRQIGLDIVEARKYLTAG